VFSCFNYVIELHNAPILSARRFFCQRNIRVVSASHFRVPFVHHFRGVEPECNPVPKRHSKCMMPCCSAWVWDMPALTET
jgi:hypothetical protein